MFRIYNALLVLVNHFAGFGDRRYPPLRLAMAS